MSMSMSMSEVTALDEHNRHEDPDFGKVTGRKRDLRWKTFRQTISEEKSIAFHSKPDTTKLSSDFIELIEEKCGDGLRNLQGFRYDHQAASGQPFLYSTPKSRDSSSTLASCNNNAKHRLEFASNQIDRDITLYSVIAATNGSHAYGFGSEAFSTEEARQIPEALTLTGQTSTVSLANNSKRTVHCPYLFINQASTSARHEIEWALNRCALDGSATLRTLDALQNASKFEEQSATSHDSLTLFSCATSHNWAILNHHWISDGQLCMAPLCKFDLRDASHTYKLQAWIEAIGKWAEVRVLPLFRQTLKTLSEWDEVLNDPLNMTPATEFDRLAGAASSSVARKNNHIRQRSDIGPVKSAAVFPFAAPATSIGLHFPASTYESTERILSWQRDMTTWQNVPRSAGLLPKVNQNDGAPKSYRPVDETVDVLDNPDNFYTCPSTPAIIVSSTAKAEPRTTTRTIAETMCKPVQQRIPHELRKRKVGDSLPTHSRQTCSASHLGPSNALRYSQSSQDTKSSLPLRSPLFQCHNAGTRDYVTPPSSVGTQFEDGLTPKVHEYDDRTLPQYSDTHETITPGVIADDTPSTYSSIEEWARQQRGLLGEDEEQIVNQCAESHTIDPGKKLGLELDRLGHQLLQPEIVSPVGGDRASMTLWIDHVLGERLICIEE